MSPSSSFFSVPARHSGRVVARQHRAGSVWAWRAPSAGHRPSPACLFLPARTQERARLFCQLAAQCGFSASVRRGGACAIWAPTSPLHAVRPAWAVKVVLPAGITATQARAKLRAQWVHC